MDVTQSLDTNRKITKMKFHVTVVVKGLIATENARDQLNHQCATKMFDYTHVATKDQLPRKRRCHKIAGHKQRR